MAGDRHALDRLLRAHYDRLHALARRMTGNDADAADVTQEALVAIARGLTGGRFEGRSRFATWAYRVTVNACLDELRRRSRRPEAVDPGSEELFSPLKAGPDTAPTDDLVAGRVDVDTALGHLSPGFRATVVLRDLCGLDYAEIGELLDLPPGTVRSRIARARSALAPVLGNPSPAPDRPISRP